MLKTTRSAATTGVLLSGGLDSAILAARLIEQGERVQPFYIRAGLVWENEEGAAVRRFLAALPASQQLPLVELQVPLADLYGDHWSVTGHDVPDGKTPDEAVFLPGRNALLVLKAALWCQLHRIDRLAIASLGTSPFDDASPAFFQTFQAALNLAGQRKLRIWAPFGNLDKRQVMQLGRHLPLELTFSCIAPRGGRHCGECNKCAERQQAFRNAELEDRTDYAIRLYDEHSCPSHS